MSKPNIFIFDDVQSELDYLEEVLNASGYLAVPAKNRKHFFGLLSRFSADLILLDIVMPNENGFSICEELKSHPKYKSIPIIFLTALTKNQDIKKGLELGAIDFISKPFNKEILLLRIKSVLQQFAQTKKYEMLFESMNNAFSVQRIITDENNKPIDYEFVEVNSVAASRFGLPRDELVGVRIKTIFPKFENKWLELFGRVALSQKAETKVDYSEEFNSYYHVHVFSPQKGYFATTFTDITEYVKVEKALKESEEKYRVIANNISDWVWKADLNLNFTYASPAVSKIRGLSVQEALSQSVEEAFPKESIQIMKAALKENLLRIENNNSKGWDPVTLEIQLYKKDKTKTWVQINARFIRDENKKPIEIIGVARDIDKQKKAELALSENEKRYRSLFESAVDPVLLMEGDQFIECNQKTIDVLGLKHKKDLLEKKPWELAPKFQPDGSLSIEKGKNAINQVVKKGHTTIDCIYLHRSGRPIWFHMSMARVRLKGKIYIYSIWRDITSKKTAEIALKESEEKYRLITDNISDLVWKSDMNLSFTYISPSVKKQRGFSQSEATLLWFLLRGLSWTLGFLLMSSTI